MQKQVKNEAAFNFLYINLPIGIAQHELLQSGPMLGYSGFREVMIWVQTTDQASVKVGYFKKGEQERFTEVVKTTSRAITLLSYTLKVWSMDTAMTMWFILTMKLCRLIIRCLFKAKHCGNGVAIRLPFLCYWLLLLCQ